MLYPCSARSTEADEDVLQWRQEVWFCSRGSFQSGSRLLEVHWERPHPAFTGYQHRRSELPIQLIPTPHCQSIAPLDARLIFCHTLKTDAKTTQR